MENEKWARGLHLLAFTLPYLLLICLTAMIVATLNVRNRFGAGACAPILLNLPLFRELAGSNDTAVFVAHMFVFYFGIFANLTPPVALAAYAGAGISGGSPNATGVQAMKLAIAGFVVPYMFVFAHSMLMIDATWLNVTAVALTGALGVGLLAVAVEGYLRAPLGVFWRLLALVGALALIYPGLISDAVGAAVAVALLMVRGGAGSARPAGASSA